jgi:formylglycine-generating enzyme required for sulfatase activity
MVKNQTRQQMLTELSAFERQLAQLGPQGVGFLYYSGHAIGMRDQNYLVPVDAQIQGITDLPVAAISMSEQLDAISLAGAHAAIIVLDACRTSFGRGARGLVAEAALTDTLIAYSSQPNALETTSGVYAQTLAQEISREGADTATAFARVTAAVAAASQRAQVPRYDNGLVEQVVFTPRSGQSVSNTAAPPVSSVPGSPAGQVPGQSFRDCANCPEMIVIPPGSFLMGSPISEQGRYDNEGPQHRVTIRQFAVSKYEITFDQWEACMRGGGCAANSTPNDANWGRGPRPAINVSWTDAQEFVVWLNTRAGSASAGLARGPYRLLSEAEWEYVARAGGAGRYWWGDQDPVCSAGANNGANFSGCGDRRTRPVGSFTAARNAFGLYDLNGNVSEWTEDCLSEGQLAPADGSARDLSPCPLRVLRGGSWDSPSRGLRSANRSWETPTNRFNTIGFRVAKTLN